jgi:hypothetical protein
MFGDRAVKEHTKLLLRDILAQIDSDFNFIFSNGVTGITFLVTRPLVREVALLDDDVEMFNEMDEEIDEAVVEKNNQVVLF